LEIELKNSKESELWEPIEVAEDGASDSGNDESQLSVPDEECWDSTGKRCVESVPDEECSDSTGMK
jgi:hypothetical protein